MSQLSKKPKSDYRILIVDDEEILLNVMAEVLELDKYQVETVITGAQALNKIKANNYDLVITDLSLTDIVGWDLADKIFILNPDCKIILATGWGLKIKKDHCEKHHINALLYKPFKMADILEVVDNVLSGSREEVSVGTV